MQNNYSKVFAFLFGSPIFLLALGIAFFSISEMGLLQFVVKLIRTHFFDTTVKYQVNMTKIYPSDLLLLKRKGNDKTDIISYKKSQATKPGVTASQEDSLL